MKQTAMQIMLYDLKDKQLVYENSGMHDSATALVTSIELAEQLIQMEKEQIINAHEQGCDDFLNERHYNATYGKGYYNETYGK